MLLIGKDSRIVVINLGYIKYTLAVFKILMLRPHPRGQRNQNFCRWGPGIVQVIPKVRQGWEWLLQKASPMPPWRMVLVLGQKLDGWREVEACSKKSDQDSEESGLWHLDNWQRIRRRGDSREYNWYLKYLKPCHEWERTVLFSLHCYQMVRTREK